MNRADALFCIRCGGPLDAAAVLEFKTRDEVARRLWWVAFSPAREPAVLIAQTDAITTRIIEELSRDGNLQRAIEKHLSSRGQKAIKRSDGDRSA